MKEKIMRFMQGRYGSDRFSRFLLIVTFVLLVISMLTGFDLLYVLAIALVAYLYFRMFSRNIAKRSAENQAYLNWTGNILRNFAGWKSRRAQSREYHIYKCPGCKQKIRVPKGKGRIAVRCPKCGNEFIKNS